MTKDRLLSDLGDLARQEGEAERARFDERWDRLAAGTLTLEEEAELKALVEGSAEAREAYEAFQPLGPDFQARVVDAAIAELAPRAPDVEPWELRSRLLPFRRAARRLEVWLGTAAAAAAALFLLLRPAALPPLPFYTALLSGGAQTYRGGEPGPASGTPVFVPGSLLTLVVRPQQHAEGPVEARAFRGPLAGGGEVVPWEPEPRFEIENGAVRLRGRVGQEVRLPPGVWRIWIVVGRPGRIPGASELAADLRAGRTRHADWQAVSQDLAIRASP